MRMNHYYFHLKVSLQMLKIVDLVKGEEIAATTTYHRLTKENSELLRRYCFYLKLKKLLHHLSDVHL